MLDFMHIIIWEYTVREKNVPEFLAAYASDGDWAKLFQRAKGFLGTELLRSTHETNTFLTIDRWQSASDFDHFQERFGAEYKRLDAEFEGWTSSEKKIGIFSESWS